MPLEEGEPSSPYTGAYVVIRPVGMAWSVGIEPAPSDEGETRTYSSKHEAFGAARDLWTANGLPCLDLTVGGTARAHDEK